MSGEILKLAKECGVDLFSYPPDAAAEIERLKKRLEIDDEAAGWDGIACRDETIKLQDEKIEWLTKERDTERQLRVRQVEELNQLVDHIRQQLAERNKDNDELVKMGLDQTQEIVNLRFQLSAAVTHGADLMRGREGWQPIETAPKDRFLLLCGPSGYATTPLVFTTGRMCSDYHVGKWIDHANDNLTDWGFEPTHWMPLPAAPKPGEKE